MRLDFIRGIFLMATRIAETITTTRRDMELLDGLHAFLLKVATDSRQAILEIDFIARS